MRSAQQDHASDDLIRTYLREVGKRPLLSADQEIALAKAIELGARACAQLDRNGVPLAKATRIVLTTRVEEGKVAHQTFVEANLRLVVSIARKYQGFGLPLLDLIQEGNLGLLRAVDKFDWRRGFKFSTYATWWIRQGISRGLADRSRTIRLPVHVAEIVTRLRRIEADLSSDLGRQPSDGEVCGVLGISEEKLASYRLMALESVSLSTPLGEDGESELNDFIEDDTCEQPDDEAVRTTTSDDLRGVLNMLNPREKRILELRFGLADGRERTLEQVGTEFKLTRERIRQIESKALARLRHPSSLTSLQGLID